MFIDIFHRKREFRGWTKIEKQIHGLELPPINKKSEEQDNYTNTNVMATQATEWRSTGSEEDANRYVIGMNKYILPDSNVNIWE